MKVKQNIISFLLGMAIMFPVGGYAVSEIIAKAVDVPVIVDGEQIDTTVYSVDGVYRASVRDIVEAMGGTTGLMLGEVRIETAKTDTEKVAEACKDSCVMIYVYKGDTLKGNASGFVYNKHIITAKHVTDAGNRYIIFTDDEYYGVDATLVGIDTVLDLSVLAINADLPSVTLGDSDKLREGQKVIAITSPSGVKNAIDECLYHGVSYKDGKRNVDVSDSRMDSGSSGGALFDTNGNLIGMVTRGYKSTHSAIPVNEIKAVLEQLN